VGDVEARRIDALVVSATNRPVEKDAERGAFRGDLLARLGHVVTIPPLRERPEDVPLLVEHFLKAHDKTRRKTFLPETLAVLAAHTWPFNVRELQQVVERAVCLVDGDTVRPEHLPEYLRAAAPVGAPAVTTAATEPPPPLHEAVQALEKALIVRALAYTNGNKRRAAELLRISADTFYRRLQDFGLSGDE
jgi:DNA-binding NtrC family response regulator